METDNTTSSQKGKYSYFKFDLNEEANVTVKTFMFLLTVTL